MAFVKSNGVVVSFARPEDVQAIDQRLFEQNEGLTDEDLYLQLKRATERILSRIRSSDWWKSYYTTRGTPTAEIDIPAPDAAKIQDRYNDFTELCVYQALADYILPKVADFTTEETAERQKMGYYSQRAETLYAELITAGDWYNFDGAGGITTAEKQKGVYNLKRVR
jgi:hypothetical protein